METIDRAVAVIKPKKPWFNWANKHRDDGEEEISPENLSSEYTALLIPEYDYDKEAHEFIGESWEEIFENELAGWIADETTWPANRTREMFHDWFEIELHSMVLDLVQKPIHKEPYEW